MTNGTLLKGQALVRLDGLIHRLNLRINNKKGYVRIAFGPGKTRLLRAQLKQISHSLPDCQAGVVCDGDQETSYWFQSKNGILGTTLAQTIIKKFDNTNLSL